MTPALTFCPWWKRPITWIILLGLCLRLGSSALNFRQMFWRNDARMSIPAVRILEGKGFSLQDGAGPTAYRPPVYILWLSGMYAIFGKYAELGPSIMQSLVGTVNIFLLYLLAKRVWKREDMALASAFLLSIHPYSVYHDAALYHTFLSTFLLLGGFILLLKGYEERSWRPLVGSGALFGLCILITSVIIPFLGFLLLLGVFVWKITWKKRLTLVAAFSLGAMCTWSPWVIRNAFAFHTFLPLTTDSGVTAWMGNNPESVMRLPLRTHEESPVPPGTRFNIPYNYEGCRVANSGCESGISEAEESKQLQALATTWIKANPYTFIRLTAWRWQSMWSPWLTPQKTISQHSWLNMLINTGYALWNSLLAVTALIGLLLAWRKSNKLFPLLSIVLALTATGSYAIFLYYTKYRIPFEAVLLPLCGGGLVTIFALLKKRFSALIQSSHHMG